MTDEIDFVNPAKRRALMAFAGAAVLGVLLIVLAIVVPDVTWLLTVGLGAFGALLLVGGGINLAVARQLPMVRHLGGLIVFVRVVSVTAGVAAAVVFYFASLLAGGLTPALISLGVVFGITFLAYQMASLNAGAVHDAKDAEPPAG